MRSNLIVVACMVVATTARADEPIVVASGDAAFSAALTDALAPAGLAVVTVGEPPPPSITDLAGAARAAADAQHGTATVWLIAGEPNATLVTYDRAVDRLLIRTLPFKLPLDDAQGAEAARMARTMLRALRVSPDTDLLPPKQPEAAAIRARAAADARSSLPMIPRDPALLAVELQIGARVEGLFASTSPSTIAALVWRPDRLGVTLAISLATRIDVTTPTFRGGFSDNSLAVLARLPIEIAQDFELVATSGLALHRTLLTGAIASGDVEATRLDPAMRVGAGMVYDFGAVSVGVAVAVDVLARRQAYDVGRMTVLEMSPIQSQFGLLVTGRFL